MKIIALLFVIICIAATGYFTMTYVWGLSVKSWPGLIAVCCAQLGFQALISALTKD